VKLFNAWRTVRLGGGGKRQIPKRKILAIKYDIEGGRTGWVNLPVKYKYFQKKGGSSQARRTWFRWKSRPLWARMTSVHA